MKTALALILILAIPAAYLLTSAPTFGEKAVGVVLIIGGCVIVLSKQNAKIRRFLERVF